MKFLNFHSMPFSQRRKHLIVVKTVFPLFRYLSMSTFSVDETIYPLTSSQGRPLASSHSKPLIRNNGLSFLSALCKSRPGSKGEPAKLDRR